VTGRSLAQPDPEAPSEANFERWANESPERLLRVLQPGELKPTLLTFAAEIAGATLAAAAVVPLLMALLEHPDSVVREGAIYGLVHHQGKDIDTALRRLALHDASPAVREAASDALADR
jgi:HEAT repeat protein